MYVQLSHRLRFQEVSWLLATKPFIPSLFFADDNYTPSPRHLTTWWPLKAKRPDAEQRGLDQCGSSTGSPQAQYQDTVFRYFTASSGVRPQARYLQQHLRSRLERLVAPQAVQCTGRVGHAFHPHVLKLSRRFAFPVHAPRVLGRPYDAQVSVLQRRLRIREAKRLTLCYL